MTKKRRFTVLFILISSYTRIGHMHISLQKNLYGKCTNYIHQALNVVMNS